MAWAESLNMLVGRRSGNHKFNFFNFSFGGGAPGRGARAVARAMRPLEDFASWLRGAAQDGGLCPATCFCSGTLDAELRRCAPVHETL